jgi:hypothetical protein
MVALTEVHSLQVGDQFSFNEDGAMYQVEQIGLIDYDGGDEPSELVLYRCEAALFGHISDHTKVWVLVV